MFLEARIRDNEYMQINILFGGPSYKLGRTNMYRKEKEKKRKLNEFFLLRKRDFLMFSWRKTS